MMRVLMYYFGLSWDTLMMRRLYTFAMSQWVGTAYLTLVMSK